MKLQYMFVEPVNVPVTHLVGNKVVKKAESLSLSIIQSVGGMKLCI